MRTCGTDTQDGVVCGCAGTDRYAVDDIMEGCAVWNIVYTEAEPWCGVYIGGGRARCVEE